MTARKTHTTSASVLASHVPELQTNQGTSNNSRLAVPTFAVSLEAESARWPEAAPRKAWGRISTMAQGRTEPEMGVPHVQT